LMIERNYRTEPNEENIYSVAPDSADIVLASADLYRDACRIRLHR